MKHLKWVLGIALLAVIPASAIVNVAQAQRFASTVDEGQKVHSSLYSSGKNINVKGEVFGDVFCAGQKIMIDAKVHGDVICAGQDVTIAGTVDGDIRVIGQDVSVVASVARNATVAAGQFSLDADAAVGQDLTAAGNLNIKGAIGRDAILSGEVILNGPIGRNAAIKSESITLKDQARIAGNLTYTGGVKPKAAKTAVVQGKTKQITPQEKQRSYVGVFSPIFYVIILIGFLLIGVLLAGFFPKYLDRTSDIIKAKPARTLLIGILAGVGVPAISFGFAITVVGIPVTFFLLLALIFGAMLSGPVTAYLVGRLIAGRKLNQAVPIMLIGGVIVVTLYFLPFIGLIFIMGAFWLGLGALLTDLYAHSSTGKQKTA